MAVRYEWQTVVFDGSTAAEATEAFDAWFGYGVENMAVTRQRIRRQTDGSLYLFLSHCPKARRYEIHVTALLAVAEEVP